MSFITDISGLSLPNTGLNKQGVRLLCGTLANKINSGKPTLRECDRVFWDAGYFGLDRVTSFQNSTKTERQDILKICSQNLLAETYLVENAGVGYMAKMALMAESSEERMLYALFAGDEATHLAEVSQIISSIELTENSFSSFLSNFLKTEEKKSLLFIVQVILEGWGLTHYRSLAKNCLNDRITKMYLGFLQAEARHHAMGLTYFANNKIGDRSSSIEEAASIFLSLVQAGPVSVVEAMQTVKGNFSQAELTTIFQELDAENHSYTRLNLLRKLMCKAGAIAIVDSLESSGCFQPFSAERCANLLWR